MKRPVVSKDRKRSVSALALAVFCLLLLSAVPANAERYIYDAAGRLVWAIYDDNSSIAYEYDANGNLLSIKTTGPGNPGDTDLDGDVDDADVADVLARILAGGVPYSPTADCNGDNRISVLDLVCTVAAKGSP